MPKDSVFREVTLVLPMIQDMEIAASTTAASLAESMRMSPDRIDEVRMAVVEAFINAFEHSRAEDHKVYMKFALLGSGEPEKLQIIIQDNGTGFAPESLEEPSIEKKLKAASKRGWGLKIIRGLMDEVEIHSNSQGTTVVMSKRR